ncbi:MAG: cell division protein FtsL [Chromatiales bacterium]|nr:cell division protein FtsL [Chromatiales bacterium]
MNWLYNDRLIIAVIVIGIFISAYAMVIVKSYYLRAFVESESLQSERDVLQDEWSRLQTENSTLRMPGYVEKSVAKLNMIYPRREIPIIVQ